VRGFWEVVRGYCQDGMLQKEWGGENMENSETKCPGGWLKVDDWKLLEIMKIYATEYDEVHYVVMKVMITLEE